MSSEVKPVETVKVEVKVEVSVTRKGEYTSKTIASLDVSETTPFPKDSPTLLVEAPRAAGIRMKERLEEWLDKEGILAELKNDAS